MGRFMAMGETPALADVQGMFERIAAESGERDGALGFIT